MQFSTLSVVLLASAAVSSAAALRHDTLNNDQIRQAFRDDKMTKHKGICTWDGKCTIPGLSDHGVCYTGSCKGPMKGKKCVVTLDDKTRCPGIRNLPRD